MKRNVQKGFTLIELMIVIAIVAILVALAVPAYKDYTIRAKVAECVNGGAVGKLQISEYYMTTGNWPTDATESGIGAAGGTAGVGDTAFCDAMVLSGTSGAFLVQVDETAVGAGGTIEALMTPNVASATIAGVDWDCTAGSTSTQNTKYLPSTCRS